MNEEGTPTFKVEGHRSCYSCWKPVGEFRDAQSLALFDLVGRCQSCQDQEYPEDKFHRLHTALCTRLQRREQGLHPAEQALQGLHFGLRSESLRRLREVIALKGEKALLRGKKPLPEVIALRDLLESLQR